MSDTLKTAIIITSPRPNC